MKKSIFIVIWSFAAILSACGPKDGEYTLHLFTTNDVHGRYFDSLYVDGAPVQGSLLAVSHYMDSLRAELGAENVVLVDAGDCLQGDNAAYYFNYVDTTTRHLYARMVEYIGYDAITVGNHDIETGHPVYDRMRKELSMPFLAGNALCTDDEGNVIKNADGTPKPYFQEYTILKRNGLKIAVVGFTNPNMKNWLSENIWHGMTFESLIPMVQEDVDRIVAKEHPHVVIVSVHSGTGEGNGSMYESQGLDLFKSLRGVDFLVCSHDHRPFIAQSDSICLINSGSHCRNLGHGVIKLTVEKGKCVAKNVSAELIPVNKNLVNEEMRAKFAKDYEAVKAFTLTPVGNLKVDLRTRDSYRGMSDYMNLIHTLSLWKSGADMSFAAPLTFNGFVHSGVLLYNDLFTIYPYENQLFAVKMTGKEIKDYLEFSYDTWINTITGRKGSDEHLLKIVNADDPRTGQSRWSFVNRSYNFDSAGGINYTVDVTAPAGERVKIRSFVNGKEFADDAEYTVAMTSYRANGGGGLMRAAGIAADELDGRVVARYAEIRNLLYDYLNEAGTIDPDVIGDANVIGAWNFVPEVVAGPAMEKDMQLLFPRRR
ncbi:MAG: 5'-nucleotidase C-terminal domain-containing protein [Bacteroidales bacterium]|nr:5'-nucleotidase C-terminal domain-containing protein [Bacteroidales bacterium]